MTDFTQALFRIDPTQGFVNYVNTVKPYHTKIMDVLIEYIYTEAVNVTVSDNWSWHMTFTRPDSEVEYSCGYGYLWDPATLPETSIMSPIISAMGKLLIDVTTTLNSSVITIVRNVSGHQLAVGDPFVFQSIPSSLYTPPEGLDPGIEYVTPGLTYYVTSISEVCVGSTCTVTSFEVSETLGGTPIIIGDVGLLEVLPQNLPYNTFLVEPSNDTSAYQSIAISTKTNHLMFSHSYDILGVNASTSMLSVRVGEISVAGTGYTPDIYGEGPGVYLTGGTGPGTAATATITVGPGGNVIQVTILSEGTKAYAVNDELEVAPGALGAGGSGFKFKVIIGTVMELGTLVNGQGYTPGVHTGITLTGGTGDGVDPVATINVNAAGSVTTVTLTQLGTRHYVGGSHLHAPTLPGGTGFAVEVQRASRALTFNLAENSELYVNDNATSAANKKYTVDHVSGANIYVNELIPPLTTASGQVHLPSEFTSIPYWPSGLKVKINVGGTLPAPLSTLHSYYFIPTPKIGVFNLATKRYPQEYHDFVDVLTIGQPFSLTRAEPYTPGDQVNVYGTRNYANNGVYTVANVTPEGNNFRIRVTQTIPVSTPVMDPPLTHDGAMSFNLGTYDFTACPPSKTPDLYAGTRIHENLQFTLTMSNFDFVGAYAAENQSGGWSIDPFGSMMSVYGSTGDKLEPYTVLADGTLSLSTSQLILPTGYDTQLFDVGSIDENLLITTHLQASYPVV